MCQGEGPIETTRWCLLFFLDAIEPKPLVRVYR